MNAEIYNAIGRLHNTPVTIVGDLMLDKYQWGEVERISPEAPVPVVRVEKENLYLGGAGNVARNVRSLGGDPYLIGVVGKDQSGEAIRKLLNAEKIRHDLIELEGQSTTEKIRVIARNQQIVRVDVDPNENLELQIKMQAAKLAVDSAQSTYLVASDYGKGLMGKDLLQKLTQNFQVILDPKTVNQSLYKDLFLMTPNSKEAGELWGKKIRNKKDIIQAGSEIRSAYNMENLLITMGGEGMAVCAKENVWYIPTVAQKVFDVTGAGDTVIAALALSLQAGNDLLPSCQIANAAAGHVVAQIGTAASTLKDIESILHKQKQQELKKWSAFENT